MAYVGKFVDRSPCLRPAGQVTFEKDKTMINCLTHEVTEDEAKQIGMKTNVLDYKLPPSKTNIYKGFFTDVRECLQPETDLGLVDILKKEFSETVYDSYWKKQVGRVPDPTPMLPAGMNPKEVCFGKPTPVEEGAGDAINPPKLYIDVISEAMKGHDLYKKTHQDYGPGEQVQRNYVAPFNRERIYGIPTPCDPNGRCVKNVMKIGVEDNILVSKILADYKRRVTPLVGKVNAPNENIKCLPKGYAFGKVMEKDIYGPGELLKDSYPNLEKTNLHQQISHINVLRNRIAKRKSAFPHRDFIDELLKFDSNKTGLIKLQDAYTFLQEYDIFPDRPTFEALLIRLGILTSENLVQYEKMADLLNVNIAFPPINKIEDVPSDFLSFETTNQVAYKYHNNPDALKHTKNIPTAGVPVDQYIPIDSLIRPADFAQYFLEAKDFFISRTPEYFRTILRRIGCEIQEEKFNMIWNCAKDKNGCVSVNSFLEALKNCK